MLFVRLGGLAPARPIITNLTSALNSLKFLDVNVLRYAHAHVKHVKNRYHKGTLKWQD